MSDTRHQMEEAGHKDSGMASNDNCSPRIQFYPLSLHPISISGLKSHIYSMRIMSFDYGTKRIGVAVTDPLQIIATGLTTVHPKDVVEFLKKYLISEQIERFIVGEPKQMDGTASQSAPQVKGFITTLKKNFPEIPVETLDERFTSKMASAVIAQSGLKKSDRQKKELVDTISATIILQSYLEQRNF